MSVEIKVFTATEAKAFILDIARLRIQVFRDFPYIYDGSIDYEVKYLERYFRAQNAYFVAALNESQLVGVSTCLPLNEEDEFIKKPFREAGFNQDKVFYFGESVLLPAYRGQGLGHRFFDEREKLAKSFKSEVTVFCAVNRQSDHPLCPLNYRPLDNFWISRGYTKQESLISIMEWKDVDQTQATPKQMHYWLRSCES